MNLVKDIFKNLSLVFISVILVILFSNLFGEWYGVIFSDPLGSFVNLTSLIGSVPAYVLFTAFIFSTWGDNKRYWWMFVLLIPVYIFVFYFDLSRSWFYILIALIGIGLGEGLRKLLLKNKQ